MKRRILSALLALSMVLTLLPGMAFAEDATGKPDSKPTVVENDLYQVEVVCQKQTDDPNCTDHWWSAVGENGWTWVNDFAVGEIEKNTTYQPETYPWRCPVTPKESLETYLSRLNSKTSVNHTLVTKELPVAYYYYNSSSGSWEFIKNADANPNCTVSTNGKNTWFLSIKATCDEEPDNPDPTDNPTTKPAVGNSVLYQVEILCQKHIDGDPDCTDHWWSVYQNTSAFTVGEIQANNTGHHQDTYQWVCPVTPAEDLSHYLNQLNAKHSGHTLVSKALPTAWFFWNGENWILPQDANPEVRFNNNVGSLTLYATCGEGNVPEEPKEPGALQEYLTFQGVLSRGYDVFSKEPSSLPSTAEGEYLILAQSGVEGDDAVYALYLNSTACPSNNGVVSNSILAARLGIDTNGSIVGYLAGTNEAVALDKLTMAVAQSGDKFTITDGNQYLRMDTGLMAGANSANLTITKSSDQAYTIAGQRTLALFVEGQNTGSSGWHTNFWGPGAAPGASGPNGSSYMYFLHPHVADTREIKAFTADNEEIALADGSFTIPAGGYITVEGTKTFTVPMAVSSVEVNESYVSTLALDDNGGFGLNFGCTITMVNGDTASKVLRSGAAGGLYYARTDAGKVYITGEGDMPDYSSGNGETPPWLTNIGDQTVKSAYIDAGVASVGANAFKATSLNSVTLADGVAAIGSSAFEGCRITDVDIPGTVELIGANAFKGCTGLTRIVVPASVAGIGAGAFANCPRLRTVVFNGALGDIPSSAFQAISGHGPMSIVFAANSPSAFDEYAGMLPFLHQNGAIVYTQGRPGASLVSAAGSDAYLANLNGGSISGVDFQSGVLPALSAKGGVDFSGWQVGSTDEVLPAGTRMADKKIPFGTVLTAQWGNDIPVIETYTVAFRGEGVNENPVTVNDGEALGDKLPTPTREGFTFAGWYNGETQFTAATPVTGDITLTAHWTEIVVEPTTYTVTFTGVGVNETSVTVNDGETLGDKLPAPTREGFTFAGWYNGETQFTAATPVTGDITLTAHWTEIVVEPTTYTVTFTGVGVNESPITVNDGEALGDNLPAPTREGYTFAGWYNGETQFTASTVVTGDITLTAHWTEIVVEPTTYTVTFTGEDVDESPVTVNEGDTVALPAPTREGYTFAGWFDGETQFTAETPVTGDITLTAHWNEITVEPATYTVTFTGVGVNESPVTVNEGDTVALPIPTRTGYTFAGWFDGETQFTAETPVTGDITLTARWRQNTFQGGGISGGGGGFWVPVTPNIPDPNDPDNPFENVDDPDVPLANLPFVDVDKEIWYAPSVAYVYAKGYMKGNGDLTFTPDEFLTRGMMAQVIHNIAENPGASVESAFTDLNGRYYTEAVAWGAANGILKGYSSESYGGEHNVTRQEMVTMLYRYERTKNPDGEVDLSVLGSFTDADLVADWAKEAMAWAVKDGLIEGRGNDDIDPLANITRAEVAAILERYSKAFLA